MKILIMQMRCQRLPETFVAACCMPPAFVLHCHTERKREGGAYIGHAACGMWHQRHPTSKSTVLSLSSRHQLRHHLHTHFPFPLSSSLFPPLASSSACRFQFSVILASLPGPDNNGQPLDNNRRVNWIVFTLRHKAALGLQPHTPLAPPPSPVAPSQCPLSVILGCCCGLCCNCSDTASMPKTKKATWFEFEFWK